MISLNVQWIPVADRSGTYQWNGSDTSSRKEKIVTFFGTGEMRGQQQAKAITPPSSDYTDAYLSTFSSKSIPTRHIHRLNTSVFANSVPIPLKPTSTPLFTSNSMKTSQTRFDDTNNSQTSNLFNKPVASSSTRSSTYSSSFVPERPTTYDTFSSKPFSSPQSQTFTSSYSTLLRPQVSTFTSTSSPTVDNQRSYSTFETRSQPSQSTFPTVYRSQTSYESIFKPMPPYSIQSYPPSNTYTTSLATSSTGSAYKPYIPFESPPLLTSSNISQSSTSQRTVLPTAKIEKQIDRPETLLFQHDEDIRSSWIGKPSPIISPSPESPYIREELKVEPERLHMEELSTTSSAPIQIFENTINKYDSLINEISKVLASVSPLSSTVSSMSPGKSVLDYQLSSDNSPILPHRRIETQPSQRSTTTSFKSSNAQPSHLIREDSYDKIVTAISDLDTVMISPSDTQETPATIKEEKEEEEAYTSPRDESHAPSTTEEETIKLNIPSLDDYQSRFGTGQEKEEVKTLSVLQEEEKEAKVPLTDEHQTSSSIEEEKEETKSSKSDEYQTSPVTEEEKKEESQTTSTGEQQRTSTIEETREETKTSSTDEQQPLPITQEEREESIPSLIEEQQVSTLDEKEDKETKATSIDEHQIPSTDQPETESIPEKEKDEQTTTVSVDEHPTVSFTEEKKEETKTPFTDEQTTTSITSDENKESATPLAEEQQISSSTEKEDKETKTTSTDEHHVSSASKEKEVNISFTDQPQIEAVTDEEKKEESQAASTVEETKEEAKTLPIDEQQTPLVTREEKEELTASSVSEEQVSTLTEKEDKETKTTSIDEHQIPSPSIEETKVSPSGEYQLPLESQEEKVETETTVPEEHQISSVTEQEAEETTTQSSAENQSPLAVKEETTISLPEESQILSTTLPSNISADEISPSIESKSDEKKVIDKQSTIETTSENADFVQEQTGLLTNVPNDKSVIEETEQASDDTMPASKTGKRVTWDEAVVDNEDDESSLSQSLTEESSTSEAPAIKTGEDNSTIATIEKEPMTIDESKTTADQQIMSSDINETQIIPDQTINLPTSIESSIPSSSAIDQQITKPDSTDLQITSTEEQLSSSSYSQDQTNQQAITDEQVHQTDVIEQQTIPSDSTERQTISSSSLEVFSNLTESQLYDSEGEFCSRSLADAQTVSTTDSSKEDTLTSDVITNEDIIKPAEELESKEEVTVDEHKIETSSQIAENIPHEFQTSAIESTTPSSRLVIVSPIDTLEDTVANRYISSDVYHGYSSDHKQFLQDVSDVDNDSTTKSLLASLRETITTPITPLIEAIQSVVSSTQTTTATHPLKTENEITDHPQDETRLATTDVEESKEETSEDKTQIEENKPTMDTSEQLKTVFESLREAAITSITAITETIQSDKQEISSTSSTEQLTTALAENAPTIEAQSLSNIIISSDEKTDDHSKTITSPTEPIQNAISTDARTEDEQTIQEENVDTRFFEHSVEADTVRDEAMANRIKPYDSFVGDTTISTASDNTTTAAEQANEQKEQQETTSAESLPSEIPELASAVQETEKSTKESVEFTPVTQHDEQVSTTTPAALEQVDIPDKEEKISMVSSSSDISPIVLVDQKTEDKTIASSISSEQIDIVDKQEAIPSEIPETPSIDQNTEELLLTEDKGTEQIPSTIITEQVSISTPITSEQIDVVDKQEATQGETATTEKPSETTTQQTADENTSTETKTTLEVLRDVITHPFSTISEKIQSILPTSTTEHTEETVLDSTDTFEEAETSKEQQVSGAESTATIEQKNDSTIEANNAESTETKTTLETIQDAITHPLATITEKIQNIFSSSTTEEVPSSEQHISTTNIDQNKHEEITETTEDTITNPLTTVVSDTVEDIISNPIDQTSSSQEKEQILTFEGSDSYLEDQIQGIETTSIISPQISDNEKTESEPIAKTQESISYKTDEIVPDTNTILVDTVRDLINDTINSVIYHLNQEIVSSDSGLTSPVTVLTVEDRSESNQSNLDQEVIPDSKISISDITWTNLVDGKSSDENFNQSFEQIKQLLEEVSQSSDNISMNITEDKTTIILPNQIPSVPTIENTIQTDDIPQRSGYEFALDSTSAITQIEKVPSNSLTRLRERSPTNTDDDSLELIHALQGHSIILPSSSPIQTNPTSISTSLIEKPNEQFLQTPEKSSSSTTTTSSQVTSSDRYVSYAIHEMGDSSQERLPQIPLAADIPLYESIKPTANENKEQEILSEPIVNINQNVTKDDDLTELDATENLTSYSDDLHLQKLNISIPNQQENLDASSTDEDVDDENFNEFDQTDISNLYRIIDEITQQSNSLSGEFEQTYQRYDLSSSSSTSIKPQTDDIYMIPGYPGLWRPSVDDEDSSQSPLANDADDEDEKNQSTTKVKTRTIVRTTNPAKLQSFLQQNINNQDIPVRSDTVDVFNRPLNEFSFDISESDSFKTCTSTIDSSSTSKQPKQTELYQLPISEQQEYQRSPDEKILLIRERERGVSLPVTMKIDYDDMALRLSASTPFDAPLYPTTQTDLPSPSTSSEPIQKTTSSSRASTPSLSSNESEQQKISSSSWLNTVNTIVTTIEGPNGPLEARTTIRKSAKGPISITECEEQGKYIIIENTSRSKCIALGSWTIRQENDNGDILTFTFPDNCLLKPNHSLKVFSKSNESERRNSDLIASLLSAWHTGSNIVTKLINADGKDRAALTKKTLFS